METELATLKDKLLTMASRAEAAVNRAVRALVRRDDDLARRTREEDDAIDRLARCQAGHVEALAGEGGTGEQGGAYGDAEAKQAGVGIATRHLDFLLVDV